MPEHTQHNLQFILLNVINTLTTKLAPLKKQGKLPEILSSFAVMSSNNPLLIKEMRPNPMTIEALNTIKRYIFFIASLLDADFKDTFSHKKKFGYNNSYGKVQISVYELLALFEKHIKKSSSLSPVVPIESLSIRASLLESSVSPQSAAAQQTKTAPDLANSWEAARAMMTEIRQSPNSVPPEELPVSIRFTNNAENLPAAYFPLYSSTGMTSLSQVPYTQVLEHVDSFLNANRFYTLASNPFFSSSLLCVAVPIDPKKARSANVIFSPGKMGFYLVCWVYYNSKTNAFEIKLDNPFMPERLDAEYPCCNAYDPTNRQDLLLESLGENSGASSYVPEDDPNNKKLVHVFIFSTDPLIPKPYPNNDTAPTHSVKVDSKKIAGPDTTASRAVGHVAVGSSESDAEVSYISGPSSVVCLTHVSYIAIAPFSITSPTKGDQEALRELILRTVQHHMAQQPTQAPAIPLDYWHSVMRLLIRKAEEFKISSTGLFGFAVLEILAGKFDKSERFCYPLRVTSCKYASALYPVTLEISFRNHEDAENLKGLLKKHFTYDEITIIKTASEKLDVNIGSSLLEISILPNADSCMNHIIKENIATLRSPLPLDDKKSHPEKMRDLFFSAVPAFLGSDNYGEMCRFFINQIMREKARELNLTINYCETLPVQDRPPFCSYFWIAVNVVSPTKSNAIDTLMFHIEKWSMRNSPLISRIRKRDEQAKDQAKGEAVLFLECNSQALAEYISGKFSDCPSEQFDDLLCQILAGADLSELNKKIESFLKEGGYLDVLHHTVLQSAEVYDSGQWKEADKLERERIQQAYVNKLREYFHQLHDITSKNRSYIFLDLIDLLKMINDLFDGMRFFVPISQCDILQPFLDFLTSFPESFYYLDRPDITVPYCHNIFNHTQNFSKCPDRILHLLIEKLNICASNPKEKEAQLSASHLFSHPAEKQGNKSRFEEMLKAAIKEKTLRENPENAPSLK